VRIDSVSCDKNNTAADKQLGSESGNTMTRVPQNYTTIVHIYSLKVQS